MKIQLPSVGINQQFITFTNVIMESDKFICVRETSPQNSLVIIDMSMPMQPLRRPITADSTLMNPNSKILDLKGYGGMRGAFGIYRLGNVGNTGELSPSSSRLKRQLSCGVEVISLGMLPRISVIEPDAVDPGILNESSEYLFGSWEHVPTSQFVNNYSGLKRELNLPIKLEPQRGEDEDEVSLIDVEVDEVNSNWHAYSL